jgi:hypothetical protein
VRAEQLSTRYLGKKSEGRPRAPFLGSSTSARSTLVAARMKKIQVRIASSATVRVSFSRRRPSRTMLLV